MQIRALKMCIQNDIRGLEIEPMEDFHGFFLCGPDGWTQYTVYCGDSLTQFSAYAAIPDVMQGFDISDEKPIKEKDSLFAVVSAVKEHHKRYSPELYAVAPCPNTRPVIYGGIFNDHREGARSVNNPPEQNRTAHCARDVNEGSE